MLISVIITTYNWEAALNASVRSLLAQHDLNFEIIIADDGSKIATANLIKQLRLDSPVPLIHCFHEDKGFRAGAIRNQATLMSQGDYLIFLDGDCIVFPTFIKRHRQLAEKGYFVPGNRLLLTEKFSRTVLDHHLALPQHHIISFIKWRLQGHINRLLPLIYLPFKFFRMCHPNRWQKAMTCNLAIWKNDFSAVNGFDRLFEGWGYEDSDLVIRLIHLGIKRKEGRFAIAVIHLWHPPNNRNTELKNYHRLLSRLNNSSFIWAKLGLINK
jgi:glycosyltransferase involved in cell wall biosynthesis